MSWEGALGVPCVWCAARRAAKAHTLPPPLPFTAAEAVDKFGRHGEKVRGKPAALIAALPASAGAAAANPALPASRSQAEYGKSFQEKVPSQKAQEEHFPGIPGAPAWGVTEGSAAAPPANAATSSCAPAPAPAAATETNAAGGHAGSGKFP